MSYLKRLTVLIVGIVMMFAVLPASSYLVNDYWPQGTSMIYINSATSNITAGQTASIRFQVENDTAREVVVSIHNAVNQPNGRICNANEQPLVQTIYQASSLAENQIYTATWNTNVNLAAGRYCYSLRYANPPQGTFSYREGLIQVAAGRAVIDVTPIPLPPVPGNVSPSVAFISSHSAQPSTFVPENGERTVLSYRLGKAVSNFRLVINDASGREIAIIRTSNYLPAGSYADVWNGRRDYSNTAVTPGTYFYDFSGAYQQTVTGRVYVEAARNNLVAPVITSVSATPTTIYQNQSSAIRYEVNQSARAEVAIYKNGVFIKQLVSPTQYNNVSAYTVNQTTWYADNSYGNRVEPGTYTYIIQARNANGIAASRSGSITVLAGNSGNNQNPDNSPAMNVSGVTADPSTLDTSVRNSTDIRFTLNQNAYVTVRIENSDGTLVRKLADQAYYSSGVRYVTWYGVDSNGYRAANGNYVIVVTAQSANNGTSDNERSSVGLTSNGYVPPPANNGNMPVNYLNVTNVTASPSTFNPENQSTSLQFYVNRAANVSIYVIDSNGYLTKTLVSNARVSSGYQTYTWDGRSPYANYGFVPAGTYRFRIDASESGYGSDSNSTSVVVVRSYGSYTPYNPQPAPGNMTSVTDVSVSPSTFNPANQNTSIQYYLTRDGNVTVRIYDEFGALVKDLMNQSYQSTGGHSVLWNGKDNNGNYLREGRYQVRIDTSSTNYGSGSDVVWVSIDRNGSYVGGTVCIANFRDVSADHSLCPAIKFVVEKGIIEGYNDGTIGLDVVIPRSDFMAIIQRAFHYPLESYSPMIDGNLGYYDIDLSNSGWFMKYAKTFLRLGIITGYNDGTLQPARTMNTAELYKAFFLAALRAPNNIAHFTLDPYIASKPYSDTKVDAESQWFLPFAQLAKLNGLVTGNRFYPARGITRGQVIELIYDTHRKGMITY